MEKTVTELLVEIRRRERVKTEIRTGSLDNFVQALERTVGRIHSKPVGVSECSASGLPVTETDLLPPNRAVLMWNGEVVHVFDLDR